jgi:hypothetical protein
MRDSFSEISDIISIWIKVEEPLNALLMSSVDKLIKAKANGLVEIILKLKNNFSTKWPNHTGLFQVNKPFHNLFADEQKFHFIGKCNAGRVKNIAF